MNPVEEGRCLDPEVPIVVVLGPPPMQKRFMIQGFTNQQFMSTRSQILGVEQDELLCDHVCLLLSGYEDLSETPVNPLRPMPTPGAIAGDSDS